MPTQLDPSNVAAIRRRWSVNVWGTALVVLAVAATATFWWTSRREPVYSVTMTAGNQLNHRYELAELLVTAAAEKKLQINLVQTEGSREALQQVAAGHIDVALVQGDSGVQNARLQTVGVFPIEPLQVFVRRELAVLGLEAFRGRKVNVGPATGGTNKLSLQMLQFLKLNHGSDFTATEFTSQELAALPDAELPDVICSVSPLPSPLGRTLVEEHGYDLLPLPIAAAMAFTDSRIHAAVVPAYTYQRLPAIPSGDAPTIGVHSLLVANSSVSNEKVTRLLEAVFDSNFAALANLPSLTADDISRSREYPLHSGAQVFRQRNQPVITGELIESLENLRSFLVSGAIAAFLVWRWRSRRQLVGFEQYLDAVCEVERKALDLESAGALNLDELRQLRRKLSDIKSETLEKQSAGVLRDDVQMETLLAHIADVRNCLESLFAHISRREAPGNQPPAATGPAPTDAKDRSN